MRTPSEFYKLPIEFDYKRLAWEIEQLGEGPWRPHPQGYEGNSALLLITAGGTDSEKPSGPMRPTPALQKSPYLKQVLAAFDVVLGRSRLMRLAPKAEVPIHSDVGAYWRDHVRIHVPIQTDPSIRFHCGDEDVHMGAGQAWVFDTARKHFVKNPSQVTRIHLVADSVGNADFWQMVADSAWPQSDPETARPVRQVPYREDATPNLAFENFNMPRVLTPADIDLVARDLTEIVQATDGSADKRAAFVHLLDRLRYDWRGRWAEAGDSASAIGRYRRMLDEYLNRFEAIGDVPIEWMGMFAHKVLRNWLTSGMTLDDSDDDDVRDAISAKPTTAFAAAAPRGATSLSRPTFLVTAPRAGSTLLFETLSNNRAFWTVGGESHREFESLPQLRPENHRFESNCLTADDATDDIRQGLIENFLSGLQDADAVRLLDLPEADRPDSVRLLEKTPKNALRIDFLKAVFPDARFVFLWRQPRANVSSIIDGWKSGRFVTYPDLPDWPGSAWSFLLPPGWQDYRSATLAEIAAFQWQAANSAILQSLAAIPADDWCVVQYEQFIADPQSVLTGLCEFLDVPYGPRMQAITADNMPLSRFTLDAPHPEKWRRNAEQLQTVLPDCEPLQQRLAALPVVGAASPPQSGNQPDQDLAANELRAVATEPSPQPKTESHV